MASLIESEAKKVKKTEDGKPEKKRPVAFVRATPRAIVVSSSSDDDTEPSSSPLMLTSLPPSWLPRTESPETTTNTDTTSTERNQPSTSTGSRGAPFTSAAAIARFHREESSSSSEDEDLNSAPYTQYRFYFGRRVDQSKENSEIAFSDSD